MDAQMKKGFLEMCILYSISKEELYGYDIMKIMSQYFPEVNESTFYAILRRLKKDGAADTYLGEKSNGPKRKYYKITDEGRQRLQNSIEDWKKINEIIEGIGIKNLF